MPVLMHTRSRAAPHDHDTVRPCVQLCAQSVRGEEHVRWPSAYYNERKRKVKDAQGQEVILVEKSYKTCAATKNGAQLFCWDTPYFWHMILAWIQIHFDAFTFDAKELAQKNALVIKSRGRPQAPHQNKITDSSVGALPKFLVYLVVSFLLGVQAYFTYTSCSGGRVYSFHNFKLWFHGLRPAWQHHIKGNNYYNHPQAFRALPSNCASREFNAAFFLVCTHTS